MSNPLYADPNITIAGFSGVSFGGLTATFPQGRGHDTFQYQDTVSWVRGNHSFKAGADITHLQIGDGIRFNSRGTVGFVSGGSCATIGLTSCTGLANFIDNMTGPSGTAGKQFGSPDVAFAWTLQAYFIQDAWKITPTLTMNYGVRYEYYGRPFNFLPYPAVDGTVLTDPIATKVEKRRTPIIGDRGWALPGTRDMARRYTGAASAFSMMASSPISPTTLPAPRQMSWVVRWWLQPEDAARQALCSWFHP